MPRCAWADSSPEMQAYHDNEWGRPEFAEQKLFELLCLELLQSGLSWQTILNKRAALREVFYDFEIAKVSQMDETDLKCLLQDERIIRHRLKLAAIIHNAKLIQTTGLSLAELLWGPSERRPQLNHFTDPKQVPAKTEASSNLAKKLKKLGFKFVGPTTVYAWMQAAGVVNDHLVGCQLQA